MLPGLPIGLSALLALAAPPSAPAGESTAIRVDFDAPAGCSSVEAFYAGLLSRTSRARRATPGEEGMRLAVRLTRAGTKVRGELRMWMMDGPGDSDTRRVEGESCDAVVEVLSLTAALALTAQPTVAQPQPPPPPPPPPPPRVTTPPRSSSSSSSSSSSQTPPKPPEPVVPEAKPPEPPKPPEQEPPPDIIIKPPPRPEPARHTTFDLGLQAVAADIMTGTYGFGGGLGARVQRHSADGPGASVGLTFLYIQNDLVQTAENVAIRWIAASATACPGWGLGRTVWVQPCGLAIGGWLSATGVGLTNPSSPSRSWWSAGALLRFGVDLGAGFSLELDAGASVPIVGHRFITTTPERTVGETPTISPMVALGLSRSL